MYLSLNPLSRIYSNSIYAGLFTDQYNSAYGNGETIRVQKYCLEHFIYLIVTLDCEGDLILQYVLFSFSENGFHETKSS